jgi:hypothetical protein
MTAAAERAVESMSGHAGTGTVSGGRTLAVVLMNMGGPATVSAASAFLAAEFVGSRLAPPSGPRCDAVQAGPGFLSRRITPMQFSPGTPFPLTLVRQNASLDGDRTLAVVLMNMGGPATVSAASAFLAAEFVAGGGEYERTCGHRDGQRGRVCRSAMVATHPSACSGDRTLAVVLMNMGGPATVSAASAFLAAEFVGSRLDHAHAILPRHSFSPDPRSSECVAGLMDRGPDGGASKSLAIGTSSHADRWTVTAH